MSIEHVKAGPESPDVQSTKIIWKTQEEAKAHVAAGWEVKQQDQRNHGKGRETQRWGCHLQECRGREESREGSMEALIEEEAHTPHPTLASPPILEWECPRQRLAAPLGTKAGEAQTGQSNEWLSTEGKWLDPEVRAHPTSQLDTGAWERSAKRKIKIRMPGPSIYKPVGMHRGVLLLFSFVFCFCLL